MYRFYILTAFVGLAALIAFAAPWSPVALAQDPWVPWPNLRRLLEVPLFAAPAHTLLVGLLLGLAALAALAIVIPTSWRRGGPGLWLTFDDRRANRFGSWRPC